VELDLQRRAAMLQERYYLGRPLRYSYNKIYKKIFQRFK